jgi:hypothetical protein
LLTYGMVSSNYLCLRSLGDHLTPQWSHRYHLPLNPWMHDILPPSRMIRRLPSHDNLGYASS